MTTYDVCRSDVIQHLLQQTCRCFAVFPVQDKELIETIDNLHSIVFICRCAVGRQGKLLRFLVV